MIEILTDSQIVRARRAGRLVSDILQITKTRCQVGTNLLAIDDWVREMIIDAGADSCYVNYSPSFGRGPFGHYICTSINDAVLHGMPFDYNLSDGDLLTLDLAIRLNGVSSDAAISFVVGSTRSETDSLLINTTELALAAGIAAARPGARIGDISHAIEQVLTSGGYSINLQTRG